MTYLEAVRQIELENLKIDEANALMSQLIQELDEQKRQGNLIEIDELLRQFSDLYEAVMTRAEQFPTDVEWSVTKRRASEIEIMFEVGDARRQLIFMQQRQESQTEKVLEQVTTDSSVNVEWDTNSAVALSEPDLR